MALLQSDASAVTKPRKTAMRMEKCLFGQQELDVPEIMMEDVRHLILCDQCYFTQHCLFIRRITDKCCILYCIY